MSKSLCKYRRAEISAKAEVIGELVNQPRYLCRSCARAANGKGALCKPMHLPEASVLSLPVAASAAAPAVGEPLESDVALNLSTRLLMSVKARKLDKKLRKLAKKKRKYEKKGEKKLKKAEKYQKKAEQAQRQFDKLLYKASA
ncbi:hypothetical protein [Photobacterium galatheae]|nr:hypothetical protein [Photobacterium galatheae]MCM0150958.1 hypothetical protein [Photobacterium galatheae]